MPDTFVRAEQLADLVRQRLGASDEPLVDLGRVVEQLGVIWFSLDLGGADDGACVELDEVNGLRVGVAVINGAMDPGRRRWTLAHELAHFLTGDAYAADHPAVDVERYLNAFVAYLLMPRSGITRVWRELCDQGPDRVALGVAARYRTSWSAACSQLANLELIERHHLASMVTRLPARGAYMAAGEEWIEEFAAPAVPPEYSTAVLSAYVSGELSGARTLDLLRGTLASDELPDRSLEEVVAALPPP